MRSKTSSTRKRESVAADDAAPRSTCDDPDVVRFHETLTRIETETIPKAQQSQVTDDRRLVARHRRKKMERRAADLLPDSEIDPDDTGEILITSTA